MSKRRDIEERVRALGEIGGIMGAMKNLALMESHKLGRALATQDRVVHDMAAAGREFLSFHPGFEPHPSGQPLYLVIGSERGFCGDYNNRLLTVLDRHLRASGDHDPALIVVGRKVVERAGRIRRIEASVEGPTVADEVPAVLTRVLDQLHNAATRRATGGRAPVTAIYHDAVTESILIRPLRPFHSTAVETVRRPFPPLLTLQPAAFFAQLVDLYFFSLLHAIFYSALMAESRARLAHLESALQRLEQNRDTLLQKRNVLRQEEITEEIEELMLSIEDPSHWR